MPYVSGSFLSFYFSCISNLTLHWFYVHLLEPSLYVPKDETKQTAYPDMPKPHWLFQAYVSPLASRLRKYNCVSMVADQFFNSDMGDIPHPLHYGFSLFG